MSTVTYIHQHNNRIGTHSYTYSATSTMAHKGMGKLVFGHDGYALRSEATFVSPETVSYSVVNGADDMRKFAETIHSFGDVTIVANPDVIKEAKAHRNTSNDDEVWAYIRDNTVCVPEENAGICFVKMLCTAYDDVSYSKDYSRTFWNDSVKRDPLFAFNHLCNFRKMNEDGLYYVCAPNDGIGDVGKLVRNVGYSVVELNKPDEYINKLLDTVRSDKYTWCNLDRVYNTEVSRDINRHRPMVKPNNYREDHMFTGNNELIVTEIKPIGVVLRGIGHMDYLRTIMSELSGMSELHPVGKHSVMSVKVNDLIYKDKKLNDNIPNGAKTVTLPNPLNHNDDIILPLGKSLPSRIRLNQLAKVSGNMYMIHWMDAVNITRYGFYVETDSGRALYTNFYTDLIFHKQIKK